MKKKSLLSMIITLTLCLSLFQPLVGRVSAAGEDYFESNALTINGEATTWLVTGARSETFKDGSAPAGFEYYSGNSLSFSLTKELSNLAADTYQFSVQLFSGYTNISSDAKITVETSVGTYSKPISYAGSSWETPATLSFGGIEVGEDGAATVTIHMISDGEHYGYMKNIVFTPETSVPETPVKKAELKPNSAILRPQATAQLQTTMQQGQTVSYSSADESIATVSETGLVTAVSDGTTKITAEVYEVEELVQRASSDIFVSSTLQQYNNTSISVEPVESLVGNNRDDFMMGADISTLYALKEIDRKYYDQVGNESDLISILQDSGVNWVRLRAWVDPTDGNGNSYGGGHVDEEAMVAMATEAKQAGMKVLIDLHYSDFWTDPGRQSIPKSWVNADNSALTQEQLTDKIYDYTYETLEALVDAGVYPDMIQIGNEINDGLLWPTGKGYDKAKPYIASGIQAVRDFEADNSGDHIDLVLHRANPNDGVTRVENFYDMYQDIDYDVIGLSYYPYWHGSISNLQAVMDNLATKFDKRVAVVETSYAYTLEDTILNGNTGHSFGATQVIDGGYLATPQGQASAIRDVIAAVADVPNDQGVGVFYWEPGWLMGTDTGWGTTYAANYQGEEIPTDGGSGWANQALFNYFGEALPSLEVFNLVRSAEQYVEPTVENVDAIQITTSQFQYVVPPTKVKALFSDDTYREVAVQQWTPSQYDVSQPGEVTLQGTLATGDEVTAYITIRPYNFVVNPGYESSDLSAWSIHNATRESSAKYSGSYALHFWISKSDSEETETETEESMLNKRVSAKQTITNLPKGKYQLSVQTRIGTDSTSIDASSKMYAKRSDGTEYSEPLVVTGWDKWQQIIVNDIVVEDGTLEIGVIVDNVTDDYGDFDDWELLLVESTEEPGTTPTPSTSNPSTGGTTTLPLTMNVVDGAKVWRGVLSAGSTQATIDVSELLTGSTNDVLMLQWGTATVQFTIEQLQLMLEKSNSKLLTFTWNEPVVNTEKLYHSHAVDISLGSAPFTILVKDEKGATLNKNAVNQVSLPLPQQGDGPSAIYEVSPDGTLHFVSSHIEGDHLIAQLLGDATYIVASVTKQYRDVNEQPMFLRMLTAMGVVQGDPNGSARLDSTITRAEISKMLVALFDLSHHSKSRALNFAIPEMLQGERQESFSDVSEDHWANQYIQLIAERDWLQGTGGGKFSPSGQMSYEQLYTLIARVLDLKLSDNQNYYSTSAWASSYVNALVEANILSVEQAKQAKMQEFIIRDDAMELFYEVLLKLEN